MVNAFDASQTLGRGVDISEKIKPHEWEKLPWRWIVERTLAWFNHSRRLSKDYEILTASAEAVSICGRLCKRRPERGEKVR